MRADDSITFRAERNARHHEILRERFEMLILEAWEFAEFPPLPLESDPEDC